MCSAAKSVKVVVLHGGYGCDTGCCGHIVKVGDAEIGDFQHSHPFEFSRPDEPKDETAVREWARDLAQSVIEREYGAGHIADLDWEHCSISEE